MMIAESIRFVLMNIPLVMFVAALGAASALRSPLRWSERYLAWLLLLSVGVDSLWAGIFHVFFPQIASEQIGWRSSPFEFEVGVADIALGIVAIASFWCSLSFKTAIAIYAMVFYIGVTIGHMHDAVVHQNFSPDNFGVLLLLTILRFILLGWLLIAAWRQVQIGKLETDILAGRHQA
jgi:hypothetical protein